MRERRLVCPAERMDRIFARACLRKVLSFRSLMLALAILVATSVVWRVAHSSSSTGAPAGSLLPKEVVLFSDNFNDGNLDAWTIVDDEPGHPFYSNLDLLSKWHITLDGHLAQDSNIFRVADEWDVYLGTHAYAGSPSWTDYIYEVSVKSDDDGGIGILFRYVDSNNYYRFFMLRDRSDHGPFRRLDKNVHGKFVLLASDRGQYEQGTWYTLRVTVEGTRIRTYIDGRLVFDVDDDTFSAGKIGLMCFADAGAHFDNIVVRSVGRK